MLNNIEEEDDEAVSMRFMLHTTVDALLKAPDPVSYLGLLIEHRLLDESCAKRAALEYIASLHCTLHPQLVRNDIKPFYAMSLEGLKDFMRFVHQNKLDRKLKDRGPCASMF